MVTFFFSTSLWVYAEPILALHLSRQFQIPDWVTPMFFLIFSLGYLAASLLMYLTNVFKIEAYILSSAAFILTGFCHILLIIWYGSDLNVLICIGFGLFLMSFFSTFTLVPIYSKMIKSLDDLFDFERVSREEVIDKSSSLTVLMKSLA